MNQHQQHQQMKLPHSDSNDTELERLLDENYGLIVSQALSFYPKNKHELEELIQYGAIGFIKGYRTYDPEHGSFAVLNTYLCRCIRNEIFRNFTTNKSVETQRLKSDIPRSSSDDIKDYIPFNMEKMDIDIVMMKIQGYNREEICKELGITINQFDYRLRIAKEQIREANE